MVSTAASQLEGSWLEPQQGLSVWSLHVLPVLVWVSSRFCIFLPQSKDLHVWLTGGSELPVGVIHLHVAL